LRRSKNDKILRRRKMNERTTNDSQPKKSPKADPRAETPDPQRMGAKRQRGGNGPEASSSSPHLIPVEKSHGTRGSDLLKRDQAESGSGDETVKNRESEAQRDGDPAEPGIDAFKKKDELGLSDRKKGCSYSSEQRQRIVESLFSQGTPKAEILKTLVKGDVVHFIQKSLLLKEKSDFDNRKD
jgi:hypothetical protein